jgi:hypothetical protein
LPAFLLELFGSNRLRACREAVIETGLRSAMFSTASNPSLETHATDMPVHGRQGISEDEGHPARSGARLKKRPPPGLGATASQPPARGLSCYAASAVSVEAGKRMR